MIGISEVSKDIKDIKDVKNTKDMTKDCLTKPLSKMNESEALRIREKDLKELEEFEEFKDMDLGELESAMTFYFAGTAYSGTPWKFEDGPILKTEDLNIYKETYSLCILHGCSENIQITELSYLSLLCKSHRAEVYEKYKI